MFRAASSRFLAGSREGLVGMISVLQKEANQTRAHTQLEATGVNACRFLLDSFCFMAATSDWLSLRSTPLRPKSVKARYF